MSFELIVAKYWPWKTFCNDATVRRLQEAMRRDPYVEKEFVFREGNADDETARRLEEILK